MGGVGPDASKHSGFRRCGVHRLMANPAVVSLESHSAARTEEPHPLKEISEGASSKRVPARGLRCRAYGPTPRRRTANNAGFQGPEARTGDTRSPWTHSPCCAAASGTPTNARAALRQARRQYQSVPSSAAPITSWRGMQPSQRPPGIALHSVPSDDMLQPRTVSGPRSGCA